MKILHMVSFGLVVVGAINWGLVGLLDLNLVTTVFGSLGIEKLVYILVGASGVFVVLTHMQDCKACAAKK